MHPKISLEQWRALATVVEAGGYAQASEQLHKTQSSVTYAVQKIERLLGLKAFTIEGRKAVLTPAGHVLHRRARALLDEALSLEHGAASLAAGWEPEVRLAAEIIFPTWALLRCFASFAQEQPQTRIQLYESVLGGTDELLMERRVDFAIAAHVPQGFAGDALMPLRFIAAAHPDHPLHQLGRELDFRDLRKHRQLVIRDTAQQRVREAGSWQEAEQRYTFSNKATAIAAACLGLGFSWYPEDTIRAELAEGRLKPLPLREGRERFVQLYLVFADRDYPGRAAWRLGEIIRETVATLCAQEASTRRQTPLS
ncbi:LysR family transcriptional regulator [Solimonas sp. K1W22B-7]|uniref:LysR family transcriptional regulator n=1 Tax=Solimonas sp. K1W22B-7 TaxID=2303331 RepID=UPI000E32FDA4|nr:LysR family transcriptional regulator [Solimonas sp. K1W22B-7]AXQ30856.1 LysR family transcriptional regulator [Solimonas sp. K1W22B-7]